jgi:hypothetical protein
VSAQTSLNIPSKPRLNSLKQFYVVEQRKPIRVLRVNQITPAERPHLVAGCPPGRGEKNRAPYAWQDSIRPLRQRIKQQYPVYVVLGRGIPSPAVDADHYDPLTVRSENESDDSVSTDI